MKTFSISSRNLILATTIFLVSIVPLRSQHSPQEFLDAHNKARAAVGVGPLTWDLEVANFATTYANLRRVDCTLKHSEGPYGENFAWHGGNFSAVDAVDLWVSEKSNYDYNSNECAPFKMCSGYTQVVWRDSVKLGCAKVRCLNGGTFINCNYDPAGNYVGERPY